MLLCFHVDTAGFGFMLFATVDSCNQSINLTAATMAMSTVPSLFGSLPLSSLRPPSRDALLAPLLNIVFIIA